MLNAIFGSFIAVVLALAIFGAAPSTGTIDTDQLLAEIDAFPNLTADDDEAAEEEVSIFDILGSGSSSNAGTEVSSESVELSKTGYWIEDDGTINYAFVVSNNSQSEAAETVKVNVIAKDSAGNILDTTDDSIYYVFAGGSNAFGGRWHVEGVDTVEFTLTSKPRDWSDEYPTQSRMDSILYAQSVNANDQSSRTKIAGEIVNDSDQDFGTVWVNVLFYDGDKLLGGFNTSVDATANSTVPFSQGIGYEDMPAYSDIVVYLDPYDM